jgi:hypothetical protein
MAKVALSIEAESYPHSPIGYSVRSKKNLVAEAESHPASAMAGGLSSAGAIRYRRKPPRRFRPGK